MRKIAAFTLGSVLAFGLGFSLLPESFGLLIGWLGPVFGTSFHVLLSMIFLIFGDPIRFTTLLLIWVGVGLICGLIVRRRLGSLSSVWLIYGVMFFVIFVSILRIIEIITELGILERPEDLLFILPPMPPGSSLGVVLSAPVISDAYSVMKGISFTTPPSPMEIVMPLLGSIIFNPLKNLGILSVSSLIGCEIGKIIERFLLVKRGKSKALNGGGNLSVMKKNSEHFRFVPYLFILILIASLSIFPVLSKVAQGNSYYAEGIFAFATPDGTAYLSSAFIDSEMSLKGIDLTAPEFEDAIMGILLSHDTSAATLPPILTSPTLLEEILPPEAPREILQNLSRYYELVPRTVFLIIYVGVDANTALHRADIAASDFSQAFGISLEYLIMLSQEVEIGEAKRNVTFLAYQTTTTLHDIGRSIMDILPVSRGGLAEVIDSAYRAGILTPSSTNISANGTVISVGFFSSPIISSLLETMGPGPQEMVRLILPNATAPTPILGLFSYWINRLHSSPFTQIFNVGKLLNLTGPIEFSPEATVSVIATIVPNATFQDGKVISQMPIISLVTSANLTQPEFEPILEIIQVLNETGIMKISEVAQGTAIQPGDLTVNFTQVFPLELDVMKIVSAKEVDIGQRIDVTIYVINNDADPAENVTLDDRFLLDYYAPITIEVIGNLTEKWPSIPGNSSKVHSYSIILKNEGIYTFPSAELTYNFTDYRFTARSNYVYVTVRSPSVPSLLITGIPAAWNILTRSIDRIPRLQGSGLLILSSATIVIVGLISFNEYRNIRKWLKTRKAEKI